MAVARICRLLEGIPLAIELAAARTKTMSAVEISNHLADPLALLTLAPRTAPARQQTLRATIDWSYGLLTVEEQTLLRRLAIFNGGFTLEAAKAVCAGAELPAARVGGLARPAGLEVARERSAGARANALRVARDAAPLLARMPDCRRRRGQPSAPATLNGASRSPSMHHRCCSTRTT